LMDVTMRDAGPFIFDIPVACVQILSFPIPVHDRNTERFW
jgi:hypothetical protein